MAKFEKVTKYKDVEFDMPVRKTKHSAGYDMVIAEDVILEPYDSQINKLFPLFKPVPSLMTLDELAGVSKTTKGRPTLVSTGVKCKLDPGTYLELSVRSSTPLKYWIVMANGVGIIDADYYNNPDNEGEIFFQLINLSPVRIELKRGDIIGQGIIHSYGVTEDDAVFTERTGGFGSTSE